jgi:phage baseplate assembly protein W
MRGMNAGTGAAIEGDAHLAQSVADILTTPIGTRVMRRDYGSLLFELIDAPFNLATQLQFFAAVALALLRWEPRIRLTRVAVVRGEAPGAVTIGIEGDRTDRPGPNSFTRLTVPLRLPAQQTA